MIVAVQVDMDYDSCQGVRYIKTFANLGDANQYINDSNKKYIQSGYNSLAVDISLPENTLFAPFILEIPE